MNAGPAAPTSHDTCRILSLDGGGAKGFYTLGVLREIEAMCGCPLFHKFDLIFGTSTGAIIAALLALGSSVDEIHALYLKHVPAVMRSHTSAGKSRALKRLVEIVFGSRKFSDLKTGVGIVATRWDFEKPMIFKASVEQAHGRKSTFVPGFGCSIADAVRASCSAYPFFQKVTINTGAGNPVTLIDGGYFRELFDASCPNCWTMLAIVSYPSYLDTKEAAARGNAEAMAALPELETGFADWKRRRACWEKEKLNTVEQLPDLQGDSLRFVLDVEPWERTRFALKVGDVTVWTEAGWYGCKERLPEFEALLQAKYGNRFAGLAVTPACTVIVYDL